MEKGVKYPEKGGRHEGAQGIGGVEASWGGESEGCNPGGVVVFKTEMIVCGESEGESPVKS